MTNVSERRRRENQITHFTLNILFFSENCAVYEICGQISTAAQVTDDNIIWRLRSARWITKATHEHSEYVILITSTWQQWLHLRNSVLHYTCIAFLVPVGLLFGGRNRLTHHCILYCIIVATFYLSSVT